MTALQPIISARNISFAYAQHMPGLLDISLDIFPGEYVCIVGENGSGKSTLGKILAGLALPQTGSLSFFGKRVFDEYEGFNKNHYQEIRPRVGMVFQDPAMQIVGTHVESDVAFGPENLNLSLTCVQSRTNNALETFNLTPHAQANPVLMSGGQQQRVALAGCHALQNEIIVADEPASFLDTYDRAQLKQVLKDRHREGTTIVHITHFTDDLEYATHIIALHNKTVCFDGSKAEYLEQLNTLPVPCQLLSFEEKLTRDVPRLKELECTLQARKTKLELSKAVLPNNSTELNTSHTKTDRINGQPVVAIKNLTHSLDGSSCVLRGVTLDIYQGECVALLGNTGSGKTTFLRLIAGILPVKKDTIFVCNQDIAHKRVRRILPRILGYAMQKPEKQLFEQTVYAELEFGLKNLRIGCKERTEKIAEIAEKFNINGLLAKNPFELSEGQKRKVALASIFAMDQDIILLDEPTSGLDTESSKLVLNTIKQLIQAGKTCIVVTHHISEALAVATRVYTLQNGVIQHDLPVHQYLHHLTENATKTDFLPKAYQHYLEHIAPYIDIGSTCEPYSYESLVDCYHSLEEVLNHGI